MSDMTDLKEVVKTGLEKMEAKFNAQYRQIQDELTDLSQKSVGAMYAPRMAGQGVVGELATKMAQSAELTAVRKGHASKAGFEFDLGRALQAKSVTVNDLGNGDTLSPAQRIGLASMTPGLMIRVRDAMPMQQANSSTVEWCRLAETSSDVYKQLAQPQYGDGEREGVQKAQSNYAFELVKKDVVTLAHFCQTSRQAYEDVPGLEQFLRLEMLDGVERAIESSILNGDGTNGAVSGFGDPANYVQLSASSSTDTLADSIRRGIAQLQATSFVPDTIVVHPSDWAEIEIAKTQDLAYLIGQPRGENPPSLWGVRVVPSEYQTPGTFLVGAFAQACTLYVRGEGRVLLSDSHASSFTANVLTWLAEARIALAVARPLGIVKGSF